MNLALELPAELIEAIAQRTAEIVSERQSAPEALSPYLTTDEAAEYLRAPRSRIYDLTHRGELRTFKDGTRSLYLRTDLDELLHEEASR